MITCKECNRRNPNNAAVCVKCAAPLKPGKTKSAVRKKSPALSKKEETGTQLMITDIKIPFTSLVAFIIKCLLASLTAIVIICLMLALMLLTATGMGSFFKIVLKI